MKNVEINNVSELAVNLRFFPGKIGKSHYGCEDSIAEIENIFKLGY